MKEKTMNRSPRALLLWDGNNRVFHNRDIHSSVLKEFGVEFVTPTLGQIDPPENLLLPTLKDVDAWLVGPEHVTRSEMQQAPRLKLVQKMGVGYDKIDVAAATELGVLVTYTPGLLSEAMAEHTMALMLSLAGRIPWYDRTVKAGRWEVALRPDLYGTTLGILGMGRIGKEVAKRAKAFGMKLMAYDIVHDDDFAREYGVTYASLEEVLRSADYVALLMLLDEHTQGTINRKTLSLMKPTAFLINPSRGALVDEAAVADALREGRLAGYAADVFVKVPPGADNPLLQFENTVYTPWVGAATKGSNLRVNRLAAEIIGKVLTGQPVEPAYVVNPEVWPRWRGKV